MKDLKDNEIKILRKYSSWNLLYSEKKENIAGTSCGLIFTLLFFFSIFHYDASITIILAILWLVSLAFTIYFIYRLYVNINLQKKIASKYGVLTYKRANESILEYFCKKEIEKCINIINADNDDQIQKKLTVEYSYLQIQDFIKKSGIDIFFKESGIVMDNYSTMLNELKFIKAFLDS